MDQVASRTYGDTKSSENIGSPDTESDFHGQSKQKTENGLADIKPLDLEHINDSDLEFHRENGVANESGEPESVAEEEKKAEEENLVNDENYAEFDEDYDEYWDEDLV